jgi:hypothetical protein
MWESAICVVLLLEKAGDEAAECDIGGLPEVSWEKPEPLRMALNGTISLKYS